MHTEFVAFHYVFPSRKEWKMRKDGIAKGENAFNVCMMRDSFMLRIRTLCLLARFGGGAGIH